MGKKNFINDSVKTLISTLLVAFALQLIAFPTISHILGSDKFGQILSIYAIITIGSVIIGNTLNNIRMINVNDYHSDKLHFIYFNTITLSVVIECLILFALFIEYFELEFNIIVSLIIVNILMVIRIYMNVYFRMKLHYTKILVAAIFQFIGLVIGIAIFTRINYWPIIFLMSEITIVAYTLYSLRYLRFSDSQTKIKAKNKKVISDYVNLLAVNGLNNLNTYLDRIVLLPLSGGKAVALSFLATFIGKIFSTFMYPINNVILSYISVKPINNKRKLYFIVNFYGLVLSSLIIIVSYPTTIFIVEFFYHQNSNEVKPYILIANIGVFLGGISTMIQALNTRYISITKQTSYITVHTILYILISIVLTWSFGLMGFFSAVLLANIIKVIILTLLGIRYIE
ncbi:oligosaccharide flippase family protein [Staphylococcus chromogenes]|uniref:lipopolysaccharide biosynthesis protein n=1 Tax=Staphylococcus chromogenes TaxID=46126 RepID=UPI0021CE9179|nr:oligosaccharide flippase family protein [Staphylococcus chromogenes]UXS68235.1 oligosaccharide flippase family protein [Staphylococcus chromogenes]